MEAFLPSLNNYDRAIILIGIMSYASSVIQGVLTFGDAIVFHLWWRLIVVFNPGFFHDTPFGDNDLENSTLLLSCRAMIAYPVLCYVSRKDFNWKLFRFVCPATCLTILIGAAVLSAEGNSEWLKLTVGAIFVLIGATFAYLKFVRPSQPANAADEQSVEDRIESMVNNRAFVAGMVVCSIASGLLGGVVNVSGPTYMIGILYYSMPKSLVRGTFPQMITISYGLRFIVTALVGGYDKRLWMAYLSMAVGGGCGIYAGDAIGARVGDRTFSFLVCWLLVFAGVALAEMPPSVVFVCTGLWVLSMVWYFGRKPA